MLAKLRRLLNRVPEAPPEPLSASLAALERRVRHLEAEQVELLTEWAKTRDQVLRYLKRAGALAARAEEARSEPDPDDPEQLDLEREVLRLKLARGA